MRMYDLHVHQEKSVSKYNRITAIWMTREIIGQAFPDSMPRRIGA